MRPTEKQVRPRKQWRTLDTSLIILYIALINFSELVLLTMIIIVHVLFSECFSLQYSLTEIHCERLKTRCK